MKVKFCIAVLIVMAIAVSVVTPTTSLYSSTLEIPTITLEGSENLTLNTELCVQWLQNALTDTTTKVYQYFHDSNRYKTDLVTLDSTGQNFGVPTCNAIAQQFNIPSTGFAFLILQDIEGSGNNKVRYYDIYFIMQDISQCASGDIVQNVYKYDDRTDQLIIGSCEVMLKQQSQMTDFIVLKYATFLAYTD